MFQGTEYQDHPRIPTRQYLAWGGRRDLCDGVFDDFFIAHIGLVSHEKFIDSLGGITINLLKPLFDIVE
jgi:hypothetical protein